MSKLFITLMQTKDKIEAKTSPIMWSKRIGHELYVFFAGKLIYKKWFKKGTNEKSQPSVLFNKQWPNEEIL